MTKKTIVDLNNESQITSGCNKRGKPLESPRIDNISKVTVEKFESQSSLMFEFSLEYKHQN